MFIVFTLIVIFATFILSSIKIYKYYSSISPPAPSPPSSSPPASSPPASSPPSSSPPASSPPSGSPGVKALCGRQGNWNITTGDGTQASGFERGVIECATKCGADPNCALWKTSGKWCGKYTNSDLTANTKDSWKDNSTWDPQTDNLATDDSNCVTGKDSSGICSGLPRIGNTCEFRQGPPPSSPPASSPPSSLLPKINKK